MLRCLVSSLPAPQLVFGLLHPPMLQLEPRPRVQGVWMQELLPGAALNRRSNRDKQMFLIVFCGPFLYFPGSRKNVCLLRNPLFDLFSNGNLQPFWSVSLCTHGADGGSAPQRVISKFHLQASEHLRTTLPASAGGSAHENNRFVSCENLGTSSDAIPIESKQDKTPWKQSKTRYYCTEPEKRQYITNLVIEIWWQNYDRFRLQYNSSTSFTLYKDVQSQ